MFISIFVLVWKNFNEEKAFRSISDLNKYVSSQSKRLESKEKCNNTSSDRKCLGFSPIFFNDFFFLKKFLFIFESQSEEQLF